MNDSEAVAKLNKNSLQFILFQPSFVIFTLLHIIAQFGLTHISYILKSAAILYLRTIINKNSAITRLENGLRVQS